MTVWCLNLFYLSRQDKLNTSALVFFRKLLRRKHWENDGLFPLLLFSSKKKSVKSIKKKIDAEFTP